MVGSSDEEFFGDVRVNKATILVEAMKYIRHLEKRQSRINQLKDHPLAQSNEQYLL